MEFLHDSQIVTSHRSLDHHFNVVFTAFINLYESFFCKEKNVKYNLGKLCVQKHLFKNHPTKIYVKSKLHVNSETRKTKSS
jgi:hypothetical protein